MELGLYEQVISKVLGQILGLANYISHKGRRSMNITWKLERSIAASFLKKTNKLVVG